MRNESSNTYCQSLDRNFNHPIKNFGKVPVQSFSKEKIFSKFIDFGKNKKDDLIKLKSYEKCKKFSTLQNYYNMKRNNTTEMAVGNKGSGTEKKMEDYQSSFLYSEKVQASIDSGTHSITLKPKPIVLPTIIPPANKTSLKAPIMSDKNIRVTESNSEDSRVTGGGTTNEGKGKYISNIKSQIQNKTEPDSVSHHRKKLREANPTRKVSFKVRNPASNLHRKNGSNGIITTTIKSNNVAAMAEKFDEMIRKNSNLLNDPKIAKMVDKIHSTRDKNSESSNSTPPSTLPSGINLKIIINNKGLVKRRTSLKSKSPSNSSLDKMNVSDSPKVHRKVLRVKSETTPKKRHSMYKKPQNLHKKLEATQSDKFSDVGTHKNSDNNNGDLPESKKLKHIKRKPSFKTSPIRNAGSVSATIQLFESGKNKFHTDHKPYKSSKTDHSEEIPLLVSSEQKVFAHKPIDHSVSKFKPKVPEKKNDVIKTKNIVIRDGRPKIKVIKSNSITKISVECTNEPEPDLKDENKEAIENIVTNSSLEDSNTTECTVEESLDDVTNTQSSFLHEDIIHSVTFDDSINATFETSPCQNYEITDSKPLLEVISEASANEIANYMSEEEKIYQEVSARIKPNSSFLWRTNSKTELSSKLLKEYDIESTNGDNLYEFVGLCHTGVPMKINDDSVATDEICPTFETIIRKTDDLLDIKKKEIAEVLKKEKSLNANDFETEAVNINVKHVDDSAHVVEAINYPTVTNANNIRLEICQFNVDEGYEPLEPYRSDADDSNLSSAVNTSIDSIQSYNKTNCPLPKVPETVNENIYQSLYEMESQVSGRVSAIRNYGYCSNQGNSTTNANIDSDDGYEYCTSPKDTSGKSASTVVKKEDIGSLMTDMLKRYSLAKSDSITSSIGYEKISSIYERIPSKLSAKGLSDCISQHSNTYNGVNYDECNYDENIYDTIKHADTASVSNCYESIPGSPSTVLKRQKGHSRPLMFSNSHVPYDAMSNFSHSFSGSTISSEHKTNSIYGQRSNVSFAPSELTVYGQAPSELSSSDRSDDWVDMSDQDESSGDPTIIIIRERTKAKRSPASWSRKVRHQWNKSPKKLPYSDDSSDAEHLYETLSHPINQSEVTHPTVPLDDFDSFDSDSESEQSFVQMHKSDVMDIEHAQLPEPPTTSNSYTLTKFASAAGKKMKQLKRNFTKSTRKKSTDDENDKRLSATSIKDFNSPICSNGSKEETSRVRDLPTNQFDNSYINTRLPLVNKIENSSQLKIELESKLQNKHGASNTSPRNNSQHYSRSLSANVNPQLNLDALNANPCVKLKSNDSSNENINSQKIYEVTPLAKNKSEKDVSTISRKTYLSFKSKFRRSSSATEGQNAPAPLSIRKSVFYLNEYVDAPEIIQSNRNQSFSVAANENEPPIPPSRKHNRKSAMAILQSESKTNSELAPDIIDLGNEKNTSPVIMNKLNTSRSAKVRPIGPPPPPPADHSPTDIKRMYPSKRDKNGGKTTSWYAECGLFKPTEFYKPETNGNNVDRTSSSSWYAEIGLYQAGNISTSSGASSSLSGAGTCSTTAAPSPPTTPLPPAGIFNHEPLYQFYDAAKHESVCRALGNSSDSDGYEEIAHFREGMEISKPIRRPSAMTLINPQLGPSRRLWCEIPEVIDSSILCTLTPTQKRLQEAKFEIITSEASYLNSLTVLETNFMRHPAFLDEKVINKTDRHNLFGHILPVKKCSEHLLVDLEACWQDNILLRGLCSIIKSHAEKYFDVYITYCEHQNQMIKTMQKLKLDANFDILLNQMQSEPACQSLSLHSFLMLPMQRATRLPLLMEAVLKKLDASDDEYQSCLNAFATLNNVASQCNEGARKAERIEELINVSNQIEFPFHIKEIQIISSEGKNQPSNELQRWLVRSGELTHLVWRGDDQSKLTFGKKFSKISLQLFLFTDLLIITKKKGEDLYVVVDYCKRSLLEMTPSDMMAQSPVKESSGKHIILLTMLENCECKTVEMLLSCSSETDRQRWIEACLPPPSDNPDETVYEGWDCPQVYTMYPYNSTQPDELNLQQGDIINVNKKMADGWYHGERIRDGEKGWFPGNYTTEIVSPHVRAKNLRQRYKLLALSGSYLGQQKKNKLS